MASATEAAALQPELGQAHDCCLLLRIDSVVPVSPQIIQVLADIAAAVARTGSRAREGSLALAWATSHVQQARPVPACLHSMFGWQRRHCSPSSVC